jgi:hypothetical protein
VLACWVASHPASYPAGTDDESFAIRAVKDMNSESAFFNQEVIVFNVIQDSRLYNDCDECSGNAYSTSFTLTNNTNKTILLRNWQVAFYDGSVNWEHSSQSLTLQANSTMNRGEISVEKPNFSTGQVHVVANGD